jgi:hypothetical protein
LSERDILIARQIRDLPGRYQAEVFALIIKAKAEIEEEKARAERQLALPAPADPVAIDD